MRSPLNSPTVGYLGTAFYLEVVALYTHDACDPKIESFRQAASVLASPVASSFEGPFFVFHVVRFISSTLYACTPTDECRHNSSSVGTPMLPCPGVVPFISSHLVVIFGSVGSGLFATATRAGVRFGNPRPPQVRVVPRCLTALRDRSPRLLTSNDLCERDNRFEGAPCFTTARLLTWIQWV